MSVPHAGAPITAHERARLQLYLLVGLATLAAYVLGRLFWPFLPAIVTSAIVATLIWPLQQRVRRLVRSRDAAALIGTIVAFFLIMLPLAVVTIMLLQELQARVPPVAGGAERLLAADGRAAQWLLDLGARSGLDPEQVSAAIAQQVQQVGGFLLARTMALLSGIGGWFIQAGAALFTLYYLLRDGEQLVHATRWLLPFDEAQTDRLLRLAHEAIRATVLGNIVVAIVQGVLGGIAFWLLGLPGAAFWGVAMGVLSLLPVVGPVFVWVPAAIILLLTGKVLQGVILALAGVLVISSIDNVLRSLLISGRAQLHPLAVFFSILGGIFVFGAVGLLLGPVLFVVALMVLEMARLAITPEIGEPPTDALPWLIATAEPKVLVRR